MKSNYTRRFFLALVPGSFVLGLSGCYVAPDTGVWSGTAVFREGNLAPVNCELKVSITHREEELSLHRRSLNCRQTASTWWPETFDIRGETLWQGWRQVGNAQSSGSASIELDFPVATSRYPHPAEKVRVSWSRVGSYLEFSEDSQFTNSRGFVEYRRIHAWLLPEKTAAVELETE